MDKNRVVEALQTLREELADATLDASSREALEKVTADIERQVNQGAPIAEDQTDAMSGRLQDALLEFETEHPRITGAVNQVAAALANLGI